MAVAFRSSPLSLEGGITILFNNEHVKRTKRTFFLEFTMYALLKASLKSCTYHRIYICIYIYIYFFFIYIYIFKQVLLKMMEHCLLFLIVIFKVSLSFFLCRDPGGEGIVPNLLPKRFQPYI